MSARREVSPLAVAQLVLRDIRIEHSLFALPFAYTGAVLAARGLPTVYQLVWITLAVLGARTAAMAANRYVDRDIDAQNPRTKRRALASGALAPNVMLWTAAGGLALLVASAALLNPLCVALLPIAALGIAAYPYCKRFTWGVHFVLGAVDGFAPLGAYIAVAGNAGLPGLLLFLAVTFWVAGFDIAYALMDLEVDTATGVRSIPVRFGERSGRPLALGLHVATVALLAGAGAAAGVGAIYYAGIALGALLVWYENHLFHVSENVFALNDKIFAANMAYSVCFLLCTLGGFLWHP
ncbi:MAG: 4-hydroxybenzoate octaprenyltransferase [Candidatus Baltobacteraceae bacterium]